MSNTNRHYKELPEDDSYESLFNDSNESLLNETDEKSAVYVLRTIFLPYMYCIICLLGLVGNSLVLIIFIFYEKIKTLTDMFLVNLATADLLFLCTLPFLAYSAFAGWIFGNVMCKVIMGMYNINLYTGMLTLTCITVDRFIAIAQATKAHRLQAKMRTWVKLICIAVWATAILFSIPQFVYHQEVPEIKLCIADYKLHGIYLMVNIIEIIAGFFIPLVAMIICYYLIIQTIIHARGLQKRKSLKIIIAIVAVFIATQLPYNLVILAEIIEVNLQFSLHFQMAVIITETVAYFRACLNPVLYFFIGVKFRKNFSKIIKGARCAKHSQEGSNQVKSTEEQSKTMSVSNNGEATSMYRL